MNFIKEINELHQFFQAYFRGDLDDVTRFTSVMMDEFRLIPPSGEELNREQIVHAVISGKGSRPSVEIWTSSHDLIEEIDDLLIAEYIEHQRDEGEETQRRSTVIFRKDREAFNQLKWLHVHETWIKNM